MRGGLIPANGQFPSAFARAKRHRDWTRARQTKTPRDPEQWINDSNLFERYQKPKHIFCLPEFVRSNDKLMRRQTFELLRN